jgi:nitroreductase
MDSKRGGDEDAGGPAAAGAFSAGDRRALVTGARSFLSAMERRYACKLYDTVRPLDAAIERYILECGRLSPSSFGLEHWRFVTTSDSMQRKRLMKACFDQEAVGTAAFIVAILIHRAEDYRPDSDFIRQRADRFPGGLEVFLADYRGYFEFLASRGELEYWARAQSYIACANMMTGAAAAGVDSCAIEGYREEEMLEILGADTRLWRVGVVVVFGHGVEPVRERIRESLESIAQNGSAKE